MNTCGRARCAAASSRRFALLGALSALAVGACTWAAYAPADDARQAEAQLASAQPDGEPALRAAGARGPAGSAEAADSAGDDLAGDVASDATDDPVTDDDEPVADDDEPVADDVVDSVLAPAPAGSRPTRKQALVVGSSSIKSTFGKIIAADLESWGFEVTRRGIVAAGLARPDLYDLHQIVGDMPIDARTAAVVLYVGVNDGQALWLYPDEQERYGVRHLAWHDPRWDELYTRRARTLFRSICERGAQRTIVLLPIEIERTSLEHKMRRIRRLQEQAARETSCATAVSTALDRGHFSRNGKPLRRRDGVHMSMEGARVLWSRVWQKVKPLLPPPGALAVRPRLAEEERGSSH